MATAVLSNEEAVERAVRSAPIAAVSIPPLDVMVTR